MRGVSQHNFATLPPPRLQRSTFNRSHAYKTTFGPQYLIPVFIDHMLPGDTVNMDATFFARLATLLHPVMDNLYLDIMAFFCPDRLLWDNFERFIGTSPTPDAPTEYEYPFVAQLEGGEPVTTNFATASLADYFGLPTLVNIPAVDAPCAGPFRMYNKTWNQWFRVPDLQDPAFESTGDGPDDIDSYPLLIRNKRHDYFTSCLPWPQRGDAIPIALGTSAPVIGTGQALGLTNSLAGGATNVGMGYDTVVGALDAYASFYGVPVGTSGASGVYSSTNAIGVVLDPDNSGLLADLSNATAATINDLRTAFAYQHILERDARNGTRYVEHLKGTWGVTVPDFRLQRVEFIASHSQMMQVRAVPQTSETVDAGNTPQANLAAYTTVGSKLRFNKTFVEHGYLMFLANVRADLTYQQGMERFWSRRTRFEFPHPDLMHLGEQPVYNKEIYYPNNGTNANLVFGYQERFAEERYKPSYATGSFRSNFAESLDTWHFAQNFSGIPELNSDFMEDDPPIDRALAVTSLAVRDTILFDSYYSYRHTRCMPVYSVPGLDRL